MKKIFVVLLVFICVGMVFAGGGQNRASQDTVNLRFFSWRTEDVAIYNELIKRFEAQNPGIKVAYEPYVTDEYSTVLATNFQGGTAGDIIHLRAYGNFEQFAAPGYLYPLTEADIPELSHFSATSLGGGTSIADGKIYGVPYASQSMVVYYNKELYAQLNLKVPETWNELIANLEAFSKAGINPMSNGTFTGFATEQMWGCIAPNIYGGNAFWDKLTKGETNFLDPAFIATLERFNSLTKYMPAGFTGIEFTASQMGFINGMAGHFFGGIWEAAYFTSQNPDLDFDIFVCPPDERGATSYVATYMDGSYGMNNHTPHKAEAIKFLRFLASRETQQYLSDQLGIKTEQDEVQFTSPFLQKVGSPNLISTPSVFLVGFRYEQPTGSALVQAGIQAMAAGQKTAAQVASEVQQGVALYYKPFQNR